MAIVATYVIIVCESYVDHTTREYDILQMQDESYKRKV